MGPAQQVLDLHSKASAGDGKRILRGQLAHEFDRARQRRESVADQLPISARFPIDQLVATPVVHAPPVAAVQVLDNATVIEGQIVAVVLFLRDRPAFLGCHLLSEFQYQRLTVDQDTVKVEDDGAQQAEQLLTGFEPLNGAGLCLVWRGKPNSPGRLQLTLRAAERHDTL